MSLLRARVPIRARIALSLCAIATLATLLTLVIPRHQLESDLEDAVSQRLERATAATRTLLEDRQGHLRERHRAIARTPEFRANLETGDVPTLTALAEKLVRRQPSIDAIVFSNSRGRFVAGAGESSLRSIVRGFDAGPPLGGCSPEDSDRSCDAIVGGGDVLRFAHRDRMVLGTSIPLFVRGRFVGRAAFVEMEEPSLLESWSRLSGASVALVDPGEDARVFERMAVAAPPLELRVRASFAAEREALERLQAQILSAGLFALFVAFLLATPVARSLLRPLHQIEAAVHRIRAGNLAIRLRSQRGDEFGEVARAFDTMLDHIEATQSGLERAQAIGKLGGWSKAAGEETVQVSRQLLRILELDESRPSLGFEEVLERVHPEDRLTLRALIRRCEEDGRPFELDHRILLAAGNERDVHTRGERIRPEPESESARVEGTLQDVTERKRIEEQVRLLAYRDVLTGLGNRRHFADELQRAISLGRQSLRPLAVLFLDLDDFKIVNDTLGHGIGDQLLCVVADRLSELASEMEEFCATPTVHRLGGDEFAMILPELQDSACVQRCAEQIAHRLSDPVELDGYDVQASASVGIATWPDEGLDATALLLGCDTAMYHAKLRGRGQYRFYDPSMKDASERRLLLESRLRNAIERGELEVVYQPKVEPESGQVAGLEALLRWRDADLGSISPDEFVSLAEETGQILALGEWVLRQVAEQARRWSEAGVCDLPIAVNVSSSQIESETLVETLVGILRETGLPAQSLELEITETALLRSEELAIELLNDLKEVGVKLALDDFGTGYSSLGYLRRLPIDVVKIDRSFVVEVASDAQACALVASIVEMAHVLELAVVVEGIESERQRDLLAQTGCEMIQGYFYSPAVAADAIPGIVRSGFPGFPGSPD